MNFQFELVEGRESQIQALFELLRSRVHFISHDKLTTYLEHKIFVENHPYREWYLVKNLTNYVGSFYVKNDNSIGLNLDPVNDQIVSSCLKFIREKLKPMEPVASLVPNYFYINVASSNSQLIGILDVLSECKLQVSYRI